MPRSQMFEDLLSRIRSEYTEMPGLRLTADQAARLWNLEPDQCEEALHVLINRHFLLQGADGKYARLAETMGSVRRPAMRAALDEPPPNTHALDLPRHAGARSARS